MSTAIALIQNTTNNRFDFDVVPKLFYELAVDALESLKKIAAASDEELTTVDEDDEFNNHILELYFGIVPGLKELFETQQARLLNIVRSHSAENPIAGIHQIKDLHSKLVIKPMREAILDCEEYDKFIGIFNMDGSVLLPPVAPGENLVPRMAVKIPRQPWKAVAGAAGAAGTGPIRPFPVADKFVGAAVNVMHLVELKWHPELDQISTEEPNGFVTHDILGSYKLAAAMMVAAHFNRNLDGFPTPIERFGEEL